MVYPSLPRWHAFVPAAFLALPLLVAGCAARGPAETPADPPAPATPVQATPVAPEQTSDPPVETDTTAATEAPAGIFTESQADRGKVSFDELCAECHTNNEFR